MNSCSNLPIELTERVLYIVCNILVRLGYFVGLNKPSLQPNKSLKFLGLVIDSCKQTFLIPDEKKVTFAKMRGHNLVRQDVDLLTLQKFAGKCISFMLAVPSAKLFLREVNRAIRMASKKSKSIKMSKDLRDEIRY